MEVKTLHDILIELLRSELTETELDDFVKAQLTSDILYDLYSLAVRHDLAHIVFNALRKCEVQIDNALYAKFNEKAIVAVYRNEQIKYAYNIVCNVLNSAEIPYIPLKSSVIRLYYPQETMRTSCDIDILIKEEYLEHAIKLLINKGFKLKNKNYHDVLLVFGGNVSLELHFSINESIENLDNILQNAWDYAVPKCGSQYKFTDEFFVFYMFAHISYHFLSGGCGIKSLMDIWIMEHKMGLTHKCASQLLKNAQIYRFAEQINKLSNICFSKEPKDEFSDTIRSYIFSGGVYGTQQNKIAVKKSKTESTVLYAFNRFFLPYKSMTIAYPILQKLPILLPLCWIARLFKMFFNHKTRRTLKELKVAKDISDEKKNTVIQMRKHLGL